ncbi:hypothetical protein ACJZ2D_008663 [Fusarium nematophilum]
MDFPSSPLGVRSDPEASLAARISQMTRDAPRDKLPKGIFAENIWPALKDHYGGMVEQLKAYCESKLQEKEIPAQVEGRVKSVDSVNKSLERREKYRLEHGQSTYENLGQILYDLHDLAGIRIVVDYPSDADALTDGIPLEPMVWGLQELQPSRGNQAWSSRDFLEPYCGVMFEIQATTLPEKLYNKIAHPLLYKKSAGPLPRKDEMVIDMAPGLALCYSICLLCLQDKLEGPTKPLLNEVQLQAMKQADGPDEMMPGLDHMMTNLLASSDSQSPKSRAGPKTLPLEKFLSMFQISPENCKSPGELWQWITTKLEHVIQESMSPPIQLSAIEEARFDSEDVQGSPKCHMGTRVDVRSRIKSWVNDASAETLFWLHAPAGTGKSTLARTLVDDLLDSYNFGAGYFFRRGDVDRNSTSRIFPTIASQFLETIPHFAGPLRESVRNSTQDSILKKSLEDQFRILLQKPLSELLAFGHEKPAKVIIIDGLDECHYEDKLLRFLALFSSLKHVKALRLCVLFTSRSDNTIFDTFQELKGHGSPHCTLALHERYKYETKQEIRAFLTSEFEKISNRERMKRIMVETWPAPEDISFVVDRATEPSPLFIYASTVIRFIDDAKRKRNPIDRLQTWIRQCHKNKSQLDQMYTQILEDLEEEVDDDDYDDGEENGRSALRNILGCLVSLTKPLPAGAIAALLGMPKYRVAYWLGNLRAVVHVPDDDALPVELIHTSFNDFLVKDGLPGVSSFSVNLSETRSAMAIRCRKRMM